MKQVSARAVRDKLRNLGLRPATRGDGSGHEIWADRRGRTCRPVLRKRVVAYGILYSLGLEMESKGICTRREFMRLF
jgi:hypothetical protein